MKVPPNKLASVPKTDRAPLVPGGTGLKVVIRRGGDDERIPSSEASVSPRQQAKCLINYEHMIRDSARSKTQND